MKNYGICLIIAGAVWSVVALNMDTSVGDYHNLSLADQRKSHMMGAAVTLIAGILLFGFGSMQGRNETSQVLPTQERKCPFCAELIKSEAKICRYCGKELPEIPEALAKQVVTNEVSCIFCEKVIPPKVDECPYCQASQNYKL